MGFLPSTVDHLSSSFLVDRGDIFRLGEIVTDGTKNTLDFPIVSPKMKGLICIYPLARMADKIKVVVGISDQKVILVVIGILGLGVVRSKVFGSDPFFGGWKETHSRFTEE